MTKKKYPSKFIGIDPGKTGGLAIIGDDTVKAYKCPRTVDDMSLLVGIALNGDAPEKVIVLMEKVWARPGNGVVSVWSFAENYGTWKGIIASYDLHLNLVSPQEWMKYYEIPKMEYRPRKAFLKDKARSMYPDLKKVTLSTADALLIARYAEIVHGNNSK